MCCSRAKLAPPVFVCGASCVQVTHSSTYALDKVYGWSGVCVEPTAASRKALSVRSCSVVTAVVSENDGVVAPFVTDTGADTGGRFSGLVGYLDHDVKPESFGMLASAVAIGTPRSCYAVLTQVVGGVVGCRHRRVGSDRGSGAPAGPGAGPQLH